MVGTRPTRAPRDLAPRDAFRASRTCSTVTNAARLPS